MPFPELDIGVEQPRQRFNCPRISQFAKGFEQRNIKVTAIAESGVRSEQAQQRFDGAWVAEPPKGSQQIFLKSMGMHTSYELLMRCVTKTFRSDGDEAEHAYWLLSSLSLLRVFLCHLLSFLHMFLYHLLLCFAQGPLRLRMKQGEQLFSDALLPNLDKRFEYSSLETDLFVLRVEEA